MMVVGYVLAGGVGMLLGMLGAGGSILTVPLLVYVFALAPVLATTYSLLVVGTTAAAGAGAYARQGLINWRVALQFVVPSTTAVLVVRRLIWPLIPQELWAGGLTKDQLVMIVFAVVMALSATRMMSARPAEPRKVGRLAVVLNATLVGGLTGFLGTGGGFLIVPALHLGLHLPMRPAVATSLAIIAINSLFGFALDMSRGAHVDWAFIALFLLCTLCGVGVGQRLGGAIPEATLKRSFGLFVLVSAGLIMAREVWAMIR